MSSLAHLPWEEVPAEVAEPIIEKAKQTETVTTTNPFTGEPMEVPARRSRPLSLPPPLKKKYKAEREQTIAFKNRVAAAKKQSDPNLPEVAHLRGIGSFDDDVCSTFVYADVEQAARALNEMLGATDWQRNVSEMELSANSRCVLRLRGQPWAIIYRHDMYRIDWEMAQQLAAHLKTDAICSFLGDSEGPTGYVLYENGEVLEQLHIDYDVRFQTLIRDINVGDVRRFGQKAEAFIDDFFVEQDVFEPCIASRYDIERYFRQGNIERMDYLILP